MCVACCVVVLVEKYVRVGVNVNPRVSYLKFSAPMLAFLCFKHSTARKRSISRLRTWKGGMVSYLIVLR